MKRIEYFEKKGMQWNTEALMFATASLVLLNSESEMSSMVQNLCNDMLSFGGNMKQFRPSTDVMRKVVTYLATRNDSNLINKSDIVLFKRISSSLDIGELVYFTRKVRSNSISHPIAAQYLKKLARDLNINNGKLRSLISLVSKFPNLPSKQQIDVLYRFRNYAILNYRLSKSTDALGDIHDMYVERYGNDTRYTQEKQDNRNDLKDIAVVGAIMAGTYKMTKFLTGLRRPRGESWAKKISGKVEHKPYNDQFRH